jgi:HK97 family phage portal protein
VRLFNRQRSGSVERNTWNEITLDEFLGENRHHISTASFATYRKHYRQNPAVRAAVTEIVNALTSIPLVAERYDSERKAWLPMGPGESLQATLERPSRRLDSATFYEDAYVDFVVLGNAYVLKLPEGGLHRLDPAHVAPLPDGRGNIAAFLYDPKSAIGERTPQPSTAGTRLPVDQVIHLRTASDPDNPLIGLSPIASALREIDLDNSISEFTQSVINNGGAVDKVFVTKSRIQEAEARRIERRWFRRRSGPKNAGGFAVIDGTEGSLQNVGMSLSSREMGLFDLRKQVEARILMALDVPPIVVGSVVGLENATYSNYMQARLAFHEENTDPVLTKICSALEFGLAGALAPGERVRIRPDLSRVMALLEWEDKRRRLALAEWREGLTTQTESRAETDRPPLANGDFYLLPLNTQRVSPEAALPTGDIQHVPLSRRERRQLREAPDTA